MYLQGQLSLGLLSCKIISVTAKAEKKNEKKRVEQKQLVLTSFDSKKRWDEVVIIIHHLILSSPGARRMELRICQVYPLHISKKRGQSLGKKNVSQDFTKREGGLPSRYAAIERYPIRPRSVRRSVQDINDEKENIKCRSWIEEVS